MSICSVDAHTRNRGIRLSEIEGGCTEYWGGHKPGPRHKYTLNVKKSIFSANPERSNKLFCYTFKLIEWNTNYDHIGGKRSMCLEMTLWHRLFSAGQTIYLNHRVMWGYPNRHYDVGQRDIKLVSNWTIHLGRKICNFGAVLERGLVSSVLVVMNQMATICGTFQPLTCHEGTDKEKSQHSPTLSITWALDGVSGQRHAPSVLPLRFARYPLP